MMSDETTTPSNFIRDIVDEHNTSGRFDNRVHTRFPPEPNGYLHIGHAMAICLDFGIARDYGGKCNLRFDDTNPAKEEQEYIDAIQHDIQWLGFDWEDRLFFASDYFDQLYEWAVQLIKDGKAYVDHLTQEEMREYRGTLTEPGKDSPYRNRSVEENLDLFEKMKNGEFAEGECILRAKIDMASPNINLRDPAMYRILHAEHPRTGAKWHIYPMYDYAHGQSDSIEGVTHSLCTIEYESHRPLYDWFLDALGLYHPQQIEFAPFIVNYTILSKRRLVRLVKEGYVNGWDDPRMPTLSGMRRRGYPPEAIVDLVNAAGVTKREGIIEMAKLEHHVRDHLNKTAIRRMAVLDPLKVVIENYPAGQIEEMDGVNNPEDENAGTRKIPFTREIYIDRADFMEDPPKKFYRLSPGQEVRLRFGYFITCTAVSKDAAGNIVELRATYDPETKGGYAPDGRRVKGTLHWVSATESQTAEVRLYDYLVSKPDPYDVEEGQDFIANLNPNSLEVIEKVHVERSLGEAQPGEQYQFERIGYFVTDLDSTTKNLVFNRTVGLRDTWAKQQKQNK